MQHTLMKETAQKPANLPANKDNRLTTIEKQQSLTIRILKLLNIPRGKTDLIKDILLHIKDFTGFEAVGIRLREGEDYPYYETKGFPADFIESENFLCAENETGEIVRDKNGLPSLACMCGNVIRGRTDPSKPFFTAKGSFWCNSTTELLAGTTEAHHLGRTRNHCNGQGYESVALIPLKAGNKNIGLLQFNDRRKNLFRPETIGFFEEIGESISIAFSRIQTEEELMRKENFIATVFDSIQDGISILDADLNIVRLNRTMEKLYAHKMPLEDQKCFAAYHDKANACETCPGKLALHSGKPEKDEVQLVRENGTTAILELFAYPIIGESGRTTGVVEYVRDITDRKKHEDSSRKAERMEGVFEMAGTVSHEMNQPLMAISGYSELLMLDMPEDDPLYKRLNAIVEQIHRLKNTTRKLMNITHYKTKDYLSGRIIDLKEAAGTSADGGVIIG